MGVMWLPPSPEGPEITDALLTDDLGPFGMRKTAFCYHSLPGTKNGRVQVVHTCSGVSQWGPAMAIRI